MNLDAADGFMAAWSALHFLRPHWLWALPALPLLAWWWRRRSRRQGPWRDAVDAHLLPHLLEGRSGARANGALWLGLAGVALAICALAGPSWQRAEQPLWQSRAPLVVALDLSGTALASDLPPSRLAQARAKLATLLRERAGGQVGLIAFADDAFTVAPLTDDAGNVALFLDSLAPDIMPVDGSRADRAIERSAQLLRQAGYDRGEILLLTDHAGAAARSAAASAARDGYRVSALGLGTAAGAAYRDADGRIARARLDGESLREVARAGGGAYAGIVAGDGDLAVLGVLDPPQAGTIAAHGEKTRLWRDQGYWLLLPLLLLALLAFRRGGALAAILACVLLPLQPARAEGIDWWRRADQQAHQRLQQGVQAYRGQDFAGAEKQWRGLPGAEAAYNRGNALAKQGRYDDAIAAYDEALRQRPGMADAIANRKAVEAAKKRKQPSGSQSGNKPGKQEGKGKAGQPDGRQSPRSGQSADDGKPDGDGKEARQPPAPTPSTASKKDEGSAQPGKPADDEAQRAADAAQRARMQRAMRDAGQAGPAQPARAGEQAGRREETPAERERRLANEAWLRRVPDDPGGLLRARFRLEYERRRQGGG